MQFAIQRNDLKEAITVLSKVIGKNQAIPILSAIQIDSAEAGIQITASNQNEWLTYFIKGTSGPEKPVLINFQELKDVIEHTKYAQFYTFLIENDSNIKIKANDGSPENVLKTYKQDEWPEMPHVTEKGMAVSTEVLLAIQKTIPSVSKNSAREIMKSIFLEPDGIVASDGIQLVRLNCKTGIDEKIPIPVTKFLSSSRFTEQSGYIAVIENNNSRYCVFTTDKWQYSIKAVDGTYPEYQNIVPVDYVMNVELSEDDFGYLQAEIPLLESTSETNAIHLYIDSSCLEIYSENLKSKSIQVPIKAQTTPQYKPLIKSINRELLLRAFSLGFNKLNFNSDYSPIMASDKDGSFLVFMPLRGATNYEKLISEAKNKDTNSLTNQPQNEPMNNNSTTLKPQTQNEEEYKMNETTPVRPPALQVTEAKAESMEDLIKSISDVRNKAREIIDMTTELANQVRNIQKVNKARERDFKSTNELLEKLKKVSGF